MSRQIAKAELNRKNWLLPFPAVILMYKIYKLINLFGNFDIPIIYQKVLKVNFNIQS